MATALTASTVPYRLHLALQEIVWAVLILVFVRKHRLGHYFTLGLAPTIPTPPTPAAPIPAEVAAVMLFGLAVVIGWLVALLRLRLVKIPNVSGLLCLLLELAIEDVVSDIRMLKAVFKQFKAVFKQLMTVFTRSIEILVLISVFIILQFSFALINDVITWYKFTPWITLLDPLARHIWFLCLEDDVAYFPALFSFEFWLDTALLYALFFKLALVGYDIFVDAAETHQAHIAAIKAENAAMKAEATALKVQIDTLKEKNAAITAATAAALAKRHALQVAREHKFNHWHTSPTDHDERVRRRKLSRAYHAAVVSMGPRTTAELNPYLHTYRTLICVACKRLLASSIDDIEPNLIICTTIIAGTGYLPALHAAILGLKLLTHLRDDNDAICGLPTLVAISAWIHADPPGRMPVFARYVTLWQTVDKERTTRRLPVFYCLALRLVQAQVGALAIPEYVPACLERANAVLGVICTERQRRLEGAVRRQRWAVEREERARRAAAVLESLGEVRILKGRGGLGGAQGDKVGVVGFWDGDGRASGRRKG